MPGLSIALEFVAPPTPTRAYVEGLARLQVTAFFYFITYRADRRQGGFWPGTFKVVNWAARTDWGNDHQRAFMAHTSSWEPRFILDTAQGFFRACIYRDPIAADWAWALEWNRNYRVVGFCGDTLGIERHDPHLPALISSPVALSDGGELRTRQEHTLGQHEDTLFRVPTAPPCAGG